jgi:hypothetical protein
VCGANMIAKGIAEEDEDTEIERLRQLAYPLHEVNPSRMRRIMNRLASLTKDGSKQNKTKGAA